MWQLWRFRPRPLLHPSRWPWSYYAWRLETYTGIPAATIDWRVMIQFFRHAAYRRAFWRYIRWLQHMRRRYRP